MFVTTPPEITAVAKAWTPLLEDGGAMVTAGTDVYPLPPDFTEKPVTMPFSMAATALAEVELDSGASMRTGGGEVYPVGEYKIWMLETEPPVMLTSAIAHGNAAQNPGCRKLTMRKPYK